MHDNEFPSEEEQELVRKYVLKRPLYRPNITYLKSAVIILSTIVVLIILAVISYYALASLGFIFKKVIYYSVFLLVAFIIGARWLAILIVRLYQHYASEEIRRRCLLKPTCSEFAIIVIKKYGLLIGGIKTWIRLNYKCRGNVYYIDEPK